MEVKGGGLREGAGGTKEGMWGMRMENTREKCDEVKEQGRWKGREIIKGKGMN